MSKILELFKMHNIRYICSVDDCYAVPDMVQIKATIYAEIMDDVVKYQPIFSTGEYTQLYEEIVSMSSIGVPTDNMVRDFIDSISEDKLVEYYAKIDGNFKNISKEKGDMSQFLHNLKEQNVIEDYQLISSTAEAAHLDVSTFANGAILWLVDRDFSRVKESENAGLELAKTLVERDQNLNYIYIVSAINTQSGETEDEVEKEFDSILNGSCDLQDKRSFCYFIHKGKIQTYNKDKIASSLAQGFRRKANFIIINDIRDYMKQGLDIACVKYKGIDQRTLNYVISEKVIKNGESCSEFVIRMMRLLYEEELRKCISSNFESLSGKMSQYELIYNNDIRIGADEKKATDILKTIREIELFDKEINLQHKEIGFGDVFIVKDEKYLLISQPCDVTIRKEGVRQLDYGILLRIEENKQGLTEHIYPLPCCDGFSKPIINLRSYVSLPFDLLDLCTLSSEGQAIIKKEYLNAGTSQLPAYLSNNFKVRFSFIVTALKPVLEQKLNILSLNEKSSIEEIRNKYEEYLKHNQFCRECEVVEDTFVYRIQRTCRIDEIHAMSIAQQFSNVFARIGLPFDFIKT